MDPDNLAGVAELAERLGVTRQRIDQLARSGALPAPVAVLSSGRLWSWAEVKDWATTTGRLRQHEAP